jgi:Domain of unknown function (DUF4365)
MRRPESHRTGELGEVRAIQILTEFGWIVGKLQPDYGFDLLIQRTHEEAVLADFALVQVKASRGPKASRSGYAAKVLIGSDHLELWKSVAIPSFLVLVMLPAADIFVLDCHALLGQLSEMKRRGPNPRRVSIAVPEATRVSTERMLELDSAVKNFWTQIRAQLTYRIPGTADGLVGSGIVAASVLGVLSWGIVGYVPSAMIRASGGIGGPLGTGLSRSYRLLLLRDQLSVAVGPEVAEKVIHEAFGTQLPRTSTPNAGVGADG